jgi:ribosomal protein S27AE
MKKMTHKEWYDKFGFLIVARGERNFKLSKKSWDAALKVNVPLCSSCGMDGKMFHSDLWTCSRCGLSQ